MFSAEEFRTLITHQLTIAKQNEQVLLVNLNQSVNSVVNCPYSKEVFSLNQHLINRKEMNFSRLREDFVGVKNLHHSDYLPVY